MGRVDDPINYREKLFGKMLELIPVYYHSTSPHARLRCEPGCTATGFIREDEAFRLLNEKGPASEAPQGQPEGPDPLPGPVG